MEQINKINVNGIDYQIKDETVPIADNEDISVVMNEETQKGSYKLADRVYDESNFSGKGYKILRKNIVDGKNVLTQEMINEPNIIYEIRYDFDLNEQEITIPENCVLKFEGGKINNGLLILNNTYIIYNSYPGILCKVKGNYFGGENPINSSNIVYVRPSDEKRTICFDRNDVNIRYCTKILNTHTAKLGEKSYEMEIYDNTDLPIYGVVIDTIDNQIYATFYDKWSFSFTCPSLKRKDLKTSTGNKITNAYYQETDDNYNPLFVKKTEKGDMLYIYNKATEKYEQVLSDGQPVYDDDTRPAYQPITWDDGAPKIQSDGYVHFVIENELPSGKPVYKQLLAYNTNEPVILEKIANDIDLKLFVKTGDTYTLLDNPTVDETGDVAYYIDGIDTMNKPTYKKIVDETGEPVLLKNNGNGLPASEIILIPVYEQYQNYKFSWGYTQSLAKRWTDERVFKCDDYKTIEGLPKEELKYTRYDNNLRETYFKWNNGSFERLSDNIEINCLSPDAFKRDNTTYIIRDYLYGWGRPISIGKNVTLKFEGGQLDGMILGLLDKGTTTTIFEDEYDDYMVHLEGAVKNTFRMGCKFTSNLLFDNESLTSDILEYGAYKFINLSCCRRMYLTEDTIYNLAGETYLYTWHHMATSNKFGNIEIIGIPSRTKIGILGYTSVFSGNISDKYLNSYTFKNIEFLTDNRLKPCHSEIDYGPSIHGYGWDYSCRIGTAMPNGGTNNFIFENVKYDGTWGLTGNSGGRLSGITYKHCDIRSYQFIHEYGGNPFTKSIEFNLSDSYIGTCSFYPKLAAYVSPFSGTGATSFDIPQNTNITRCYIEHPGNIVESVDQDNTMTIIDSTLDGLSGHFYGRPGRLISINNKYYNNQEGRINWSILSNTKETKFINCEFFPNFLSSRFTGSFSEVSLFNCTFNAISQNLSDSGFVMDLTQFKEIYSCIFNGCYFTSPSNGSYLGRGNLPQKFSNNNFINSADRGTKRTLINTNGNERQIIRSLQDKYKCIGAIDIKQETPIIHIYGNIGNEYYDYYFSSGGYENLIITKFTLLKDSKATSKFDITFKFCNDSVTDKWGDGRTYIFVKSNNGIISYMPINLEIIYDKYYRPIYMQEWCFQDDNATQEFIETMPKSEEFHVDATL